MSPRTPFWLPTDDPEYPFPPDDLALGDPNGLLAIGGDLSTRRLLSAYRQGIFPWYSDGQPILWWTPDPRSVLFPSELKVSRSLRKRLRNGPFEVTFDRAFGDVMDGCAAPRPGESGTWITAEMREAYCRLHELGYAHSAEAWLDGELVGGLYGVSIGRVFYGESMFARRTDASKVAFVHLIRFLERRGVGVIDCQVATAHLKSLGAVDIPRKEFRKLLARYCELPPIPGPWQPDQEETVLD